MKFGDFEFVDLADLTAHYQYDLACPVNIMGEIDLPQVARHGQDGSSRPELVNALAPTLAVLNKGAEMEGLANARAIPGLQDVWQIHETERIPRLNSVEDLLANINGGHENLIFASIPSSEFTLRNHRNNFSKSYPVK